MNVCPRKLLPPRCWDGVVDASPDGWWLHREAWLDYSLAGGRGEDRSFAVLDGDDALAVVPLVRCGDDLLLGGEPTPGPVILDDPRAPAVWQTVAAQLRYEAAQAPGRVAFRAHPGLPLAGCPDEWRPCGWESYVVDLKRPLAERWQAVRRSYHALINKGVRLVDIQCSRRPEAIWVAREMHDYIVGAGARPVETWALMAAWAAKGHLFTVTAEDVRGYPVGYVCVLHDKGWAYPMSARTRVQNLAHALWWKAMSDAVAAGCRWFECGWAERPGDDEKARGIAMFKAGFGGERWPIAAVQREAR